MFNLSICGLYGMKEYEFTSFQKHEIFWGYDRNWNGSEADDLPSKRIYICYSHPERIELLLTQHLQANL